MKAFFNILSVARYERILLLRTTRFRILGGIGVAVPVLLGGLLAVLEAQGVELAATLGLGAFIPFYVYSYLQTVVIVFIVGDFRLEDERAQVYEVVAGRPLATAELVSGKYLGVVGALLSLSLVVLVLTVMIEAAKISITGAPFSLQPYLAYLFLMTLPALFYMSALTFFLGALLRQQAAVALVAIAYSLAVLFYLGELRGGLFDFGAFFAPLFHSDMIGLGNIDRVIDQRLFYLALALCFFALSIELYPRLPQSRAWTWSGRGAALVGLGMALGLYLHMEEEDRAQEHYRRAVLEEQRAYAGFAGPQVEHYDLEVHLLEKGTPLRSRAALRVKNIHDSALDTLIFTLNPGLELQAVTDGDGKQLAWGRGLAVIRVGLEAPLEPGAEMVLQMEYQGVIERQGFDLLRSAKRIQKNKWPFIKGDLTAWIEPTSIFLPPRSLWYPVAGVDYGHEEAPPPAFATAAIAVSLPAGLEAVTQGRPGEPEISGERVRRVWQAERPVPAFSLNAGVYEVFEARLHGIDCALYVHPAHQRQILFFADAREEVLEGLEHMLDAVEEDLGLDYPYPRL